MTTSARFSSFETAELLAAFTQQRSDRSPLDNTTLMVIFTVFNDKGGVGKTTLTFHLAGAFAEAGNRVLVIDLDRQMNQSHLWRADAFIGAPTIYDALTEGLDGEFASLGDIVQPSDVFPTLISIAPASPLLGESLSTTLSEKPDAQTRLMNAFDDWPEVKDRFDIVLIDTRPDTAIATRNGIAIADFLVVPVEPQRFSMDGVKTVLQLLDEYRRSRISPHLQARFVFNKVHHRADDKHFVKSLRGVENVPVLQTLIPNLAPIAHSTNRRNPQPLCLSTPARRRLRPAVHIRTLACELIQLANESGRFPRLRPMNLSVLPLAAPQSGTPASYNRPNKTHEHDHADHTLQEA